MEQLSEGLQVQQVDWRGDVEAATMYIKSSVKLDVARGCTALPTINCKKLR